MGKKDAFQEHIAPQLRELDVEIARLQAKADQAKAQAKIEYYKRIEELRAERDSICQKFGEQHWADDEAMGKAV